MTSAPYTVKKGCQCIFIKCFYIYVLVFFFNFNRQVTFFRQKKLIPKTKNNLENIIIKSKEIEFIFFFCHQTSKVEYFANFLVKKRKNGLAIVEPRKFMLESKMIYFKNLHKNFFVRWVLGKRKRANTTWPKKKKKSKKM